MTGRVLGEKSNIAFATSNLLVILLNRTRRCVAVHYIVVTDLRYVIVLAKPIQFTEPYTEPLLTQPLT